MFKKLTLCPEHGGGVGSQVKRHPEDRRSGWGTARSTPRRSVKTCTSTVLPKWTSGSGAVQSQVSSVDLAGTPVLLSASGQKMEDERVPEYRKLVLWRIPCASTAQLHQVTLRGSPDAEPGRCGPNSPPGTTTSVWHLNLEVPYSPETSQGCLCLIMLSDRRQDTSTDQGAQALVVTPVPVQEV